MRAEQVTRFYTDGSVRDENGNLLGKSTFEDFSEMFIGSDEHGEYAEFGTVWHPDFTPITNQTQ